jgi:N-methylhydantoinase A/oxoprolinase/acetone carboxylase beta subunit
VVVEVDARYAARSELVVPYGPAGAPRSTPRTARAAGTTRAAPSRPSACGRARARRPALDAGEDARPRAAGRRRSTPAARVAGLAGPVAHHRRADLGVGALVEGPAAVVEPTSTTWVPAGATARVAEDGTLRVRGGRP